MKKLKPRPNGVASRRKLKTWVYLRIRLARACVYLRWLAMTCTHFGRDQICMQAKASFSPFGHPTQVNANWVTSINLLLANKIQEMSALKWVFACTCEENCLSVWPANASFYASSTCRYLPLLASTLFYERTSLAIILSYPTSTAGIIVLFIKTRPKYRKFDWTKNKKRP